MTLSTVFWGVLLALVVRDLLTALISVAHIKWHQRQQEKQLEEIMYQFEEELADIRAKEKAAKKKRAAKKTAKKK